MELPPILTDKSQTGDAANLLHAYFNEPTRTGLPRTGSHFDSWGGGGDRPEVVHTLTEEDIVAVSFLGMRVTGEAAFGLLHTHREDITRLLTDIPEDTDLAQVKKDDVDKVIGSGQSKASQLWGILRNANGTKWDIGATKASKLLTRKRPRLIPIYDSVIDRVTELGGTARTQWTDWHQVLTESDLPEQLDEIKSLSGITENISQLRVMDIILWMHGMQQGLTPLPEEDEAASQDGVVQQ